jgi:Domain of unknown function (DUF4153)
MTSDAIAANGVLPNKGDWPRRLAAIAILTALADWLLFGHKPGAALALFILALATGVLLANRMQASRRAVLLHGAILIAAVVPMVEHVSVISILIGAAGIAYFTLATSAVLRGDLKDRLLAIGWLLTAGMLQIFQDLARANESAQRDGAMRRFGVLKGWIVPLAFGAIFVSLFAAANPLIANWLAQWNLKDSLAQLNFQRLMFWIATIAIVWTFICFCAERIAAAELYATAVHHPPAEYSGLIFNEVAIRRSLVLFNLLFAVQSVMDIAYLWRGVALPDGMTYASYAHRGAYPLIVTALLAAAFVIAAMRPGSTAERSPLMRALVFVWVAQNVLLVISSILRLDLYVAVYGLTYWRVAAFIWMLVVASGLILIVARIVLYRSNAWLISMNLAALALTVYVCAFINFPAMVASYNVAHSSEMARAGNRIDLFYITRLGPQAVPALDRYIATDALHAPAFLLARRNALAASHLQKAQDWHAWTFRGWRLSRYLAQQTEAVPRP